MYTWQAPGSPSLSWTPYLSGLEESTLQMIPAFPALLSMRGFTRANFLRYTSQGTGAFSSFASGDPGIAHPSS